MIDWQEIQRRLEHSRQAQDRAWDYDEPTQRRILAERARRLARAPITRPVSAGRLQYLEFTMSHGGDSGAIEETYGIETHFIREVAPIAAVTPVPCTPAFIGGVVALRAQILTAIDLRPLLNLVSAAGSRPLDRIIVLGWEDTVVGLLAAQIIAVRDMSESEIEDAPPTLTGDRAKYLRGIAAPRTAILDARKLLIDPDIIVHASA